jgi:hypothetical protein
MASGNRSSESESPISTLSLSLAQTIRLPTAPVKLTAARLAPFSSRARRARLRKCAGESHWAA